MSPGIDGALGFNTGTSESPITPVIAGDGALAMKLSDRLFQEGVFAQGLAKRHRLGGNDVHQRSALLAREDCHVDGLAESLLRLLADLEILADNVRCTHGATSGQIDEDELFYLRSRGIPVKMAQRLIVTGFLNEVIQRLNHPAIAAHLNHLIEEKFAVVR